MRVKVCGITRVEDALLAAEFGAWAIGFVFHPKSPRFIAPEEARRIGAALPQNSALRVGVFMDQPEETILAAAAAAELDLLQLHGSEPVSLVHVLGAERCIKAVATGASFDLEAAAAHPAAYVLIDRPRTPERAFVSLVDLDQAGVLAQRRAGTLLAGGLAPENVGEAVRHVQPWGVDISSGIETVPGIKDPDRTAAFFDAIRRAEAQQT
ncbi:MAG: phosphoribosylanthranilate isomerase [Elusimicrobiota bacterium]